RAAQAAFGVVVGRLHAGPVGERPQRGPDLQQGAGEAAALAVARVPGGVLAQDRFELALQLPDAALELGAVAGVRVDLPCPEQLVADAQASLPDLFVAAAALGVELKVALQMRPADLSSLDRQVVVGPPAIRRHDRAAVAE